MDGTYERTVRRPLEQVTVTGAVMAARVSGLRVQEGVGVWSCPQRPTLSMANMLRKPTIEQITCK